MKNRVPFQQREMPGAVGHVWEAVREVKWGHISIRLEKLSDALGDIVKI